LVNFKFFSEASIKRYEYLLIRNALPRVRKRWLEKAPAPGGRRALAARGMKNFEKFGVCVCVCPFFLQLEAKKLYEYGKQKKYGEKMCVVVVVVVRCCLST
jgi:hypothetical protein